MSDIRLFRLDQGKAAAIDGFASNLEKPLIENNLETLLGIRLVASEYSISKTDAADFTNCDGHAVQQINRYI